MKRLLWIVAMLLVLGTITACHDGVWHWITPEPSLMPTVTPTPLPDGPAPTVEPDVVPEEEVGEPIPDPTPQPPCQLIKGNISRDGRKLYHLPSSPQYNQVVIDEAAGERIFCTEQDAIDAGWTRAGGN